MIVIADVEALDPDFKGLTHTLTGGFDRNSTALITLYFEGEELGKPIHTTWCASWYKLNDGRILMIEGLKEGGI